MSYVIRCVDIGAGVRHAGPNVIGLLLREYDPEAHEGLGEVDWTRFPEDAMLFETTIAAWQLWRTIPIARPFREDGHFNRPLTAFTVEIIELKEVM